MNSNTSNLTRNAGLKKHKISIFAAVGVVYGISAAGAFGVEDMIPAAGPGLTIVMLLIIPLVWAYPYSLICAELGSAIPEEGGFYAWIRRTFGEFWAFQGGFWRILCGYIGTPVYVVLAGDYMGGYFGWSNEMTYIFKLSLIAIFTYVNYRGVADMAKLSAIMSGLIIIAFIGINLIGFSNWNYDPFTPFVPVGQSVPESIGYALAVGLWLYAGFEVLGTVAGELKNPQIVPKALMIGLPLVMLTYIPTTIASLAAVGQWESWGTDGISFGTVAALISPTVGAAFVIVAFLGQVTMFNTILSAGSRSIYVLAEDNLFPKAFKKCNKKHGVPHIALFSISIACVLFCSIDFSILAVLTVTTMMLYMSVTSIAGLVLRFKEPDLERPFKIKGGTVIMGIMAFCVPIIAIIALLINGTDYFMFGAAIVVPGPLIYWALKKTYGGIGEEETYKTSCLNKGDYKRFSVLYITMSVLTLVGYFFLPWYDDPAYYTDVYGIDNIFSIFMTLILVISVTCFMLSILFYTLGKKKEKEFS